MATIGKLLLASAVQSQSIGEWLGLGPIEHLFKPTETSTYEFIQGHVKKYGAIPKAETVYAHLKEELPNAPEKCAYYHDLMVTRYLEQEVKLALKVCAGQLQPGELGPAAAMKTMAEAVMSMIGKRNAREVTDFRDSYDELVADIASKFHADDDNGLRFGWPSVDDMTGGMIKGEMCSMVGRPAMGKTMQMLYGCHNSWSLGQPQMFVSMEMTPLQFKQRLAALQAKVPAAKVKTGELSTSYLSKLKTSMLEIKSAAAPLWILDGNFTSTVEDIWALVRQLQPAGIWIDGGYLVKHPKERDRYKRVAENADMMKQMIAAEAPTVVSWQFSKPPKDAKKKGYTQGLDDIGYSDAIAQVSSLVLGMLAPETSASSLEKEIEILKGRNGESGKFRTNFDWVGMNFSEIPAEAVPDLNFI